MLRQALDAERARSAAFEQRIAELKGERAQLQSELAEALKLSELQQTDIDRYRPACERHCSEWQLSPSGTPLAQCRNPLHVDGSRQSGSPLIE